MLTYLILSVCEFFVVNQLSVDEIASENRLQIGSRFSLRRDAKAYLSYESLDKVNVGLVYSLCLDKMRDTDKIGLSLGNA